MYTSEETIIVYFFYVTTLLHEQVCIAYTLFNNCYGSELNIDVKLNSPAHPEAFIASSTNLKGCVYWCSILMRLFQSSCSVSASKTSATALLNFVYLGQ